jgi:hypothetical protein
VAFVALAVTDKKLRSEIGEQRVLWWLLQCLCAAPKSRDLCDVVVYCFLPGQVDGKFKASLPLSDDELLTVAANPHAPFIDRLVAHWRAWGPKFPCSKAHGNPATTVPGQMHKLYDLLKLPPLFRFIASQGFRGTGEALSIPIPFVYQLMLGSETGWADKDPFEDGDDRRIGSLFSATYDKHTWAGKAAIKTFYRTCAPVKAFLKEHCAGDPLEALERAIFYTEGALLRPRFYYHQARALYDEVLRAKLASNGFAAYDTGIEFYLLVQQHLGVLHEARSK